MRILIISNYYPPLEVGGWEQLTRDVAIGLEERGHKVFVLTSNYRAYEIDGPESGVSRLLHLESPDHFNYHAQYTLLFPWRARENRRHLSRVVAKCSPDVVFINGLWNLAHDIAQHAEVLCSSRVVYYMASYWPTEKDPHTNYWRAPAARPWLRLPKRLIGALVIRTLLSGIQRYQPGFAHVLCVSAYVQRYMMNDVGVPRAHARVVHNGIDVERFTLRQESRASGSPLRLLYTGGLWEHKGVHTAVEAMGHLASRCDVNDVHLTLVGSGSPSYVKYLQDRVCDLDIEDLVTFRKRVSRDQMPALLHQYDCLVFPSIWEEPLARMVQEAMACGLVVIGSGTGGTPELLRDGKTGLTFEAGHATMLADKILQVIRNPDLRQGLAHAARYAVEERFTIDRMVDEVEACLGSVVESGGDSR